MAPPPKRRNLLFKQFGTMMIAIGWWLVAGGLWDWCQCDLVHPGTLNRMFAIQFVAVQQLMHIPRIKTNIIYICQEPVWRARRQLAEFHSNEYLQFAVRFSVPYILYEMMTCVCHECRKWDSFHLANKNQTANQKCVAIRCTMMILLSFWFHLLNFNGHRDNTDAHHMDSSVY